MPCEHSGPISVCPSSCPGWLSWQHQKTQDPALLIGPGPRDAAHGRKPQKESRDVRSDVRGVSEIPAEGSPRVQRERAGVHRGYRWWLEGEKPGFTPGKGAEVRELPKSKWTAGGEHRGEGVLMCFCEPDSSDTRQRVPKARETEIQHGLSAMLTDGQTDRQLCPGAPPGPANDPSPHRQTGQRGSGSTWKRGDRAAPETPGLQQARASPGRECASARLLLSGSCSHHAGW